MGARIAEPVNWLGYGPGSRRGVDPFPARLTFALIQGVRTGLDRTASYSMGIGPSSSGIKWPEREAYIHFDLMPGLKWVELNVFSTI
jgi:hypothetical protein